MRKFISVIGLTALSLVACATAGEKLGPNSPDVVAKRAQESPAAALVVTADGGIAVVWIVDSKGNVKRIDSSSGIPYQTAIELAESAKILDGVDATCSTPSSMRFKEPSQKL